MFSMVIIFSSYFLDATGDTGGELSGN